MTVQDVLDRGLARGRSIWPAFKYQLPQLRSVNVSEREVIFGLYSGAYLHGFSYLREVTYEALAQMIQAYNQAMAELTADEQRTVIDVTAKRYTEMQTLAAKDAALLNKERKVVQKTFEVDAKFEALEADRQALSSKLTELYVAKAKSDTLLKELDAKIKEQELDSAHVDAEITRQELIALRANLDVLETGIRALEIQAQVAEAAYRMAAVEVRKVELESDIGRIALDTVDVDVRKAQTEADTARLKAQKESESLTASELSVEQAQTIAQAKETELLKNKVPLFDQRIASAAIEIKVTIPKLSEAIAKENAADLQSQETRNQHQVADYGNRQRSYENRTELSNTLTNMEIENHLAEKKMIDSNADSRSSYDDARVAANKKKHEGAEKAALIMAFANITNTLTHQIMPKE